MNGENGHKRSVSIAFSYQIIPTLSITGVVASQNANDHYRKQSDVGSWELSSNHPSRVTDIFS